MRLPTRAGEVLGWTAAVVGPAALTAALAAWGGSERRDDIVLYLGLVAVLGLVRGMWPALVAAALSLLLVAVFFVPPAGTMLAFAVSTGAVGLLASGRAALTPVRRQERVPAPQEVDPARRELLASVSHELRPPLSTILSESTSPLTSVDGNSEADRRLLAIAGEARRLELLVDDMLDLAVIESGALELRLAPARLADAIEAAVDRLHHTSPDRAVEWDEAAAGVDVLADRGRLVQVLDNLLANADRFGPPGTPIEIGVEPDDAGTVAVRVRHHGPAVAREPWPRLFERFVPGPTREGPARPAGTGLGLAIVKGLVEAHAGSVAVEANGGDGAAFRFTLPLAQEQT